MVVAWEVLHIQELRVTGSYALMTNCAPFLLTSNYPLNRPILSTSAESQVQQNSHHSTGSGTAGLMC